MNKELWSNKNKTVGIKATNDAFVVYDKSVVGATNPITGEATTNEGQENELNKGYHARMFYAIKDLATRVSKQEAETLEEYMTIYMTTIKSIQDTLERGMI